MAVSMCKQCETVAASEYGRRNGLTGCRDCSHCEGTGFTNFGGATMSHEQAAPLTGWVVVFGTGSSLTPTLLIDVPNEQDARAYAAREVGRGARLIAVCPASSLSRLGEVEGLVAERDRLRAACEEVIEWYDRDGSVGGLVDPIDSLRAALAAPPDQGSGGGGEGN